MTKPQNSSVSMIGGRWLYPFLVAMETIGVILLYWHIVPLYKQLVGDPTTYQMRIETRIWSIAAIALIQVGYWLRYRLRPVLPNFVNPFVGHLAAFAGRMGFTVATAIFSFVFISQKLASQLPIESYGLTLAGVFSLFCYTQELQRLGNAIMGREKRPSQAVD